MKPQPIILLVDDDDDFLMVARRAIQREGVRADVVVAHDGLEALRTLGLEDEAGASPRARDVELIILDLRMPSMSGWDVIHRIREARRTRMIPIVVMSSSDRPDDAARCYALGANSFVLKRFDPRGPGSYVADVARYWTQLNHSARSE
ncbi:MAG: response regulator [Candidatus Eisenbacteria bacterium]|uniref:Response regulator n=1 Tax=Eiseniibacteriota bacterium TaxID=2212470 RepID=A0A849SFB7_UNCEI|nr:response regulator [Candidatus Eisenbacteria bacterium]